MPARGAGMNRMDTAGSKKNIQNYICNNDKTSSVSHVKKHFLLKFLL